MLYRFLATPAWRVTLYGRYARPIADFNYGFQRDLEAAHATADPARTLPFSFGCHWRDGSRRVMLSVRPGTGR